MNHGIFSYMQLIIGNPTGDGLIELQVEMGLQLLIQQLPLNIGTTSTLWNVFFAYFISDGIFVFRSVFSNILGGMCILGP